MTPEQFAAAFPEAMKALCEGRAAVMPVRREVMKNGNTFAPKTEVLERVSTHLFERLDRR